ncbi:MAG: hypothetical protein EXR68_01100 [Dehalococcoidia bacterium]|nr:hypothetical protein [Dehalococcoidia bacterium]
MEDTVAEPQYETFDPSKHGRDTPQSTFGPVVKVEKVEDGRIHVITMNRPHRMNSIGDGMGEALYDAWIGFRDDPQARVAILTGTGDKAFCAGADLLNAAARSREPQANQSESLARRNAGDAKHWIPLAEKLGVWKPTIAAINGYAIAGGFQFAMQCDIRVMSETARVGIAEARWNITAAHWAIPLTRQIGLGPALELTLWGDTLFDAQRCYQLGWANRVAPPERLMDTAMKYAQRALDMAPRAVRNMKEAMYRGYYMDPILGEAYGGALEANLAGMQDSAEGPRAFAEKRRPNFTDS